jgi:hypothetical protein
MKVLKNVIGIEPVSIDEMRQYLRITHELEDVSIISIMKNARINLENATGLSLVETEIELTTFIKKYFQLPFGPVASITEATLNGEPITINGDEVKGSGELIVKYNAGPYECDYAIKEMTAFNYFMRGTGEYPASVLKWIMLNTKNLWLQ